MADIFDIPEMQAIADKFVGEETPEVEEEVEEAAAPEEVEESDAGDEGDAGDESPAADKFDEAIAKALEEERQGKAVLHQQLQLQQLHAQKPRLLEYEELNDDLQKAVMDEATRAGVDPQTVLYLHYKAQEQQWTQQVNMFQSTVEHQYHSALNQVRDFVLNNEFVASLGDEDRDKFIASIGKLPAIEAIDELASTNPRAWAKAAISIASERIAVLAASKSAKSSSDKEQRAMKASLGTKTSAKAPATRVHSPTTQESKAQFILEAASQNGSWDSRLRPVK